jgi:hypothetical protein
LENSQPDQARSKEKVCKDATKDDVVEQQFSKDISRI